MRYHAEVFMPAAENTNNFWNLGWKIADYLEQSRQGRFFIHRLRRLPRILKEKRIDALASHRIRKIWRDTRGRVPNFAFCDFGVF
jgi:hypothetical protein